MSTMVVLMKIRVPVRANSTQSNSTSWLASFAVQGAGSTRPPAARAKDSFDPMDR